MGEILKEKAIHKESIRQYIDKINNVKYFICTCYLPKTI